MIEYTMEDIVQAWAHYCDSVIVPVFNGFSGPQTEKTASLRDRGESFPKVLIEWKREQEMRDAIV
ncbi:MAG: hypothetical protein KKB59_18975 [Spirochaetes bacterium]|nr:hypothetical protein [Spirochaetota bacterium]